MPESRQGIGDCPYAEYEWACCKREGHAGPHESAPLAAVSRRSRSERRGLIEVMPRWEFALWCFVCQALGFAMGVVFF